MDSTSTDVVVKLSTVVNARDCGALVTIAAAFSTTLSLLILAARLFSRWPWRTLLGYDDLVTSVATALCVAQSVVAVKAVSAGLGVVPEDLSDAAQENAEKVVFAAEIIFVVVVYVSKIAVSLLLHRLASQRFKRIYAIAIIATSCACCIASVLAVAVHHTGAPWLSSQNSARSLMNRWIAYAVMSNLLDISLSIIPALIIHDLQMPTSRKFKIIFSFSIRLILLPISILRLLSLNKALRSEATLFEYAYTEIFTQVEMCVSILCATIPSLQVLLASVHTGLLDLGATTTTPHHTGAYYGGGSAAARSSVYQPASRGGIESPTNTRLRKKELDGMDEEEEEIELTRLDGGGTTLASVTSCRAKMDNVSVSSDDSGMAIRVKQTVDLHFSK